MRKQQGLSIAALAERAGRLEPKYLGGVERGIRNPTLDVLTRIAGGLQVDLPTILDTYEVEDAATLRRELRARIKGMSEDQLRRTLRVLDATI